MPSGGKPAATGEGLFVEVLSTLVFGAFTLAWRFRTELAIYLSPWWILQVASMFVGVNAAVALGLAIPTCALIFRPSRRWARQKLYVSRMRRMWEGACKRADVIGNDDRASLVMDASKTPAGDRLTVRIHRGGSVDDLARNSERIAAAIGVQEVRIERDFGNAAYAYITVARCDPLDIGPPLAWPQLESVRLSIWDPIPVGVDAGGETIYVRLPERNVLIGGEPGSGKSVALSMLVATAAMDPTAKLWLLDGKMVELATWANVAERSVGPSIEDAISLLDDLRTEMDRRYQDLLAAGLRKVEPGSEMPLHVVVCDELAFYLSTGDRKQRAQFADLMRDLVSRGRAAGIIVVAATQKPSHDIIPTSLRDLFGFRWALRCNTPQASDTILGSGWASQEFDASTVPGYQRGVGYLLAEESLPRRIRSFYLADDDLAFLAARAGDARELARSDDAWT